MLKTFDNKLVAILNKSIETGRLMNALAHMSIGIGNSIEKEALHLSHYKDADNGSHPYISDIPFIILEANSNKIRKIRQEAIDNNIIYNDFTDTMIVGTYKDQLEKTAATAEADLTYFGIVLFGDWQKLAQMTKKFSLFKERSREPSE